MQRMRKIVAACAGMCACIFAVNAQDPYPNRYVEPMEASQPNRQREFSQMNQYVQTLHDRAPAERDRFFVPDYSSEHAFAVSKIALRERLCERIGYPPPLIKRRAEPQWEFVRKDAYASVYRLRLEVLEGVEAYAILCVPHDVVAPAPLLICQHGGGGNPELISGFIEGPGGTGNYGWMVQRALLEGYVTLAPAVIFPFGGKETIEGLNRAQLDQQLQYLGTSMLAVELWKIFRCVDAAIARPDVDRSRIGMMGLSYGGMYTLYATALDPRIQAAVSSCFFNERKRYTWQDWSFSGFMNEFNDAEVCALICPRPLLIEVGANDTLFAVDGAKAEAERAKRYWTGMSMPERFVLEVFDGGHEFKGDQAYDFVRPYLNPVPPPRQY